jgi:rhodanese-related sulfurtransferase
MSDRSSAPQTHGYAGDLPVSEAWEVLRQDPKAQLIDVRTVAEWSYVGVPDLSGVGRELITVEWQRFPSMAANPDFVAETKAALARSGTPPDAPLLFLCRSGVRSRAAAIAMTQAGFARAYNVAGGFEGDLDPERHRGGKNGWKASGLPWRQS